MIKKEFLGYIANSEICHEIHHIAALSAAKRWRSATELRTSYGVGLLGQTAVPAARAGSPAVTGTKSDCEAPTTDSRLQSWPPPPS